MSSPASSPSDGPAATLVVRGLCKAYDVGPVDRPTRRAVLRDLSLIVDRGDCVALVEGGVGALTLLRCIAGLVTPDAGTLAWRDRRSRRAWPPTRSLVEGSWRPAARCLSVRDVLEVAVPAGCSQADAARRVADAAGAVAVGAQLTRAAAARAPPARWRVGLAAALVAGAEWLLVELPPAVGEDVATVRAALLAARARGATIVAGVSGDARAVPATRTLHWRGGRLLRAVPATAARRVAEPSARDGAGVAPLTPPRERS